MGERIPPNFQVLQVLKPPYSADSIPNNPNQDDLKKGQASLENSRSKEIPFDRLLSKSKIRRAPSVPPFDHNTFQRLKDRYDRLKERVEKLKREIETLIFLLENPEYDLDKLPTGLNKEEAKKLLERYKNEGKEEFVRFYLIQWERWNDDLYNTRRMYEGYLITTRSTQPPDIATQPIESFTAGEPNQILSTYPSEGEQCFMTESTMAVVSSDQCSQQGESNNPELTHLEGTIKKIKDIMNRLRALYNQRKQRYDDRERFSIIESGRKSGGSVPPEEYEYFKKRSELSLPKLDQETLRGIEECFKDSLFAKEHPLTEESHQNIVLKYIYELQKQLANRLAEFLQRWLKTQPLTKKIVELAQTIAHERMLTGSTESRFREWERRTETVRNYIENPHVRLENLGPIESDTIREFQREFQLDPQEARQYLRNLYDIANTQRRYALQHRVNMNTAIAKHNKMVQERGAHWYEPRQFSNIPQRFEHLTQKEFKEKITNIAHDESNNLDNLDLLRQQIAQLHLLIRHTWNNLELAAHYYGDTDTLSPYLRHVLTADPPSTVEIYEKNLEELYDLLSKKYVELHVKKNKPSDSVAM